MYLGSTKPRRRDSPWRVLILVVLIIGGLYVLREQLTGATWTRPFHPPPTPTRSAGSYFDEGEALYAEGLLDEAIVAYEKAFRADPSDNIILFRLARLLIVRGQAALVLEEYGSRLQDEQLGDARTLAVLGMALDWHAVFNSEALLDTYVELGIVTQDEIQADDWEYEPEEMTQALIRGAHRICERALRLDPDLPEAYANLAEALADRERFEEAEAAAATAVELNPNNPYTQRALGFVYEAQGKYDLAVAAYEAALAVHPKLAFLHLAVGKASRAIGYQLNLQGQWDESMPHFEKAVSHFEEAIALAPGDPSSFDEIGWTYGHYMGEDRELKQRGLDYLEEAIRQDPDYALAYRHLGQVYYDLRNYEEAIPALEKGLELGGLLPSDAIFSHIMIGWSYYVLERDGSMEERCGKAFPHFQAARDILGELPRRELGLEQLAAEGLDVCKEAANK